MDDKNKLTHIMRCSLNICTTCDLYEEYEDVRLIVGSDVDRYIECVHRDACVRAYKLGVKDGQ